MYPQEKPKVLSSRELLERFNAERTGQNSTLQPKTPSVTTDPEIEDLFKKYGAVSDSAPKVPEAKPVQQDTTKPTAEFDGTLDWNTLEKAKKEYEEGSRQSFKQYGKKKLQAGFAGLGEMAMEIPQGIEAWSNTPAVMLTEALIRRKVRRGEMDPEAGDYLMKEAKSITPRRTITGNMVVTDQMPGELLADSDLNKRFEATKKKYQDQATRYDKDALTYIKSGQYGNALGAIAGGILESLPATLAAAIVPGGATALGVGVGSTQYDEVKDREDMSEAMKIADAVTTGTFEWLFERWGTKEMTKWLGDIYRKGGKEGIVNAVNSNAVQQIFAKAYKKFGVWFAPIHEGLSEMLTTWGQNVAAIFSGEDPERKWHEGSVDSFLVGTGMGQGFAMTFGLANKLRGKGQQSGSPLDQAGGPVAGPLEMPEADPEQMIRDLGKKYAYNGFNGELPDQNFIKYGEMKDGRKVIIKSTNFATDPANMLVAVVDAENPESKPEMTKGNMINNSMDVPYEQWVQNEMRNYQATMSQISNETAKATAPVQEGATIPIGEQLFNVTQVTDQGIVLNEIDKEGNLTANSQTITPDKYGEVFGMPAEEGQPQAQAPAEEVQPQAVTTQQPAGEPAQPTTVSPQSRKVSDGKNEFTIIPQEDGNFRMSESFETQKEAETALKKLQERYPKLTWSAEMTDSGDLFTPDTYTIVAEPKKKPAAPVAESPKIKPEQKPVEAPAAAPEVKAEAVQPVSQTPSFPDETAAEEEVQNAGEMETQTPKGVPTYAQKKQIVLDHFGGMYEDAAASSPEQIYEQVPEVTPEDARQIHAEIKSEFEAEQDKTRNAPDPFVSIAKAEGQVDLRPTEAQKESGNYKKGHLNIKGFDISIENPAGSVRSGVSKDGTKWSNLMNNTYGYFRRTEGKDGDQVDVFLGDNLDSDAVYVVDQVDPETGVFDEVKTMLGFSNVVDAANAYLSNYEDGWKGMGNISATDIETFKQWLKDGDTKKPYKTAGTWTKVYPGVSTMVADEGEMPKPEEQTIQVLRGSRDRGMRGVEQEFPEVSGGNGQASVAQGNAGSSGQQRGLLQGELSVDRLDNTVTEQEKHTSDNSQRQNTVSVGLGKRDGDSTTDAKAKTSELPLDNRKNSNNTGKDTEGESQEGGIAPPEDTRPVKKLKEKKGWPMSKADEARLSREPQSFEEAVYQFFIGRGRISTAALKHHLGTRSREDYASYIWAHKKDGQKTDKLNEAHIFQAHPELLKQTGDQQDQERAFMDILLSVHGLNDMRTRIDEMQRKADEINAEPVAPKAEEEIDYIDAGQVVDEEILPLEEEDPEILRIFELEINELGKTLDDLKNLAANDPDYFQVFPYGLNEKQFNELKSILNDTERQKQIIGLDHEVNQSESRSEGDNEVPGSPEPESRTDGEGREEGGTEEPAISAEQLERERAAIEEWLPTSDHEDYISFEWDGESLEIFKGRDERIVGLSRDQLIEEGVRFPEAVAPAVGLKTSNHTVRSYANGLIDLDKAKEKINLALASLTSGRGFNQSFEDYMEQNPDVRKRNDELEAIKAYLATNPTPEQTREVLTEPLSNAKPEFAGELFEQPQLTFEEKISKATELGAAAFAKGAKRVPAQDKDLVELTSGVPVGKATPILDAWIKAWDKANLAQPIGVEPAKAIWQMTKQDFAYSPLRYDTMPTTDGSGIFRAEENSDGTWNAWVEFPDGKRDYWTRGGSAGEAWDGGKRKTAYMNQEADTKSLDRHRDAVIQALKEGQPVPEEVLRNYIGLKDYLEKQKKKEAAKPREKESPIPAKYREQVDNLKVLVNKESEGLDANRRIAEINAIESPTKAQIKERNQLRLILDNTRAEIARRNEKVDYNIIPENKAREIRKLIEETRAQDEAIGQRILRLQDERDAKEKSLQKRAGLFGDRKEEEERKSGMQPMFAGEIFEATSDNLQAALKPFNDAIKKAEEEWKRNAQLLDQKIALVLSGAQMEIEMEPPAEPATTKPIDKESLPKHEDFGEKIGGARKDMGITRTVRETDALPAWRRKYFYADPSGVMNLGDPTIDTSKPFLVKWSKEVKSWSGTRTMDYPVTTIDTREPKIFNSEAEAEAYIPIYEVWKQNFRIRKKDGNYVITKTSSTGKVVEYATFPTEEEATTYLYSTEGATSLLNHKREDFSIPALDKVERTGKDWRKGKDISTDEFMETFGFRGGEFGNWVKPEERRVMLNAAYDSFMDLAEMLKVPPRAMSLSGELSIAFGARGTKGAAAHFEPDRAVINLTRMNGAGSLAHEWAHALDNYFGLQAAKKDYTRNEEGELKSGRVMRTTADLLSKRGMRKELSDLFDAIVDATQEKSVTRVMGIDEKQKAYDGQIKRLKDEAEALIRKFENGVRRYKYDRKAKKHGEVIVKATPEQIKRAKAIIDKIIDGKGTRPKWAHIPGSKGHLEYSYISPETMALEEVYKEVFGKSGLKRDGNGFYNLGYFADKAYAAREILDKALAGESETLSIPTDFLKTSKIFDRSRANPYWSTQIEMFARAFEYFIETKLEEQNIRADYLQYDKAPVYDAVYEMNPYPAGDERTALNELFQKFFDEVKTKEEGGRTTMFRTSNQAYYSPIEKALEAIKQNKATAKQWKAMLLNNGAKQAELDWMGWDDFAMIFGNTSDMERKHLQTWIDQNRVEIKDITLSDEKEYAKGRSLELKAEAGRRAIDEIQEEIGFRPYRVAVTGEWVYRDDDSEIQNVPEEYIDDLEKADEAIQALNEFDEAHIDITGEYNLGGTKYGKYVLPGGENYKELLLTMPTAERARELPDGYYVVSSQGDEGLPYYVTNREGRKIEGSGAISREEAIIRANKKLNFQQNVFKSSHWDEPNILAHVRFNTRTSEDGKNILFIEEIQSDWAQQGKKKGFRGVFDEQRFEKWYKENKHSTDPTWEEYQELSDSEKKEYRDAFTDEIAQMGFVPNMPFKKTDQWAGLAIRRMIKYAIDEGFDAIAWTTGAQQGERYDLSKKVKHIAWEKNDDGTYNINAPLVGQSDENSIYKEDLTIDQVGELLGKEIADKIQKGEGRNVGSETGWRDWNILEGENLSVGGSGMKAFYDEILPSIANKIGKKHGAQVKEENLPEEYHYYVLEDKEKGTFSIYSGNSDLVEDGWVSQKDAFARVEQLRIRNGARVHSLPITDSMFNAFREGVPMFRRGEVPKPQYETGYDALARFLEQDEADDQRYEAKTRIESLSEELNTPVKAINNRNELPPRVQAQAKRIGVWENETMYGAWDEQTGTMYVLMDDLMKLGPQRATTEGIKTVLHEAVAHKGLPILLGDRGYDNLVNEIYDSIPDDDLTLIRYQYGWTEDKRLIAEEYLGMMAEDNVNPSLFQRIIAKIRQLLRKYFKVAYSKNDVYTLLRASRKNLENAPEEERGFYRSRPQPENFEYAGEFVQAQGTYFRTRKAASVKRNSPLGKAAEAYMEKAAKRTGEETVQGIREYIQDLSLPIRRFEEELLRRGGKQDNTSKPYRDMSLSFGRQEKLYNDYFEGNMKPILQAVADIKRAGIPGEDILPYIIAKHAMERNPAFRSRELKEWVESHKENVPQDEVNAKMEELKDKDYSGVMGFDTDKTYTNPDELARDIVSEFEGKVDAKLINNLWNKIGAATSEILDTWQRGHQITPEQKQEYLSQFRYFVPLRGWREGAAKELVYTKGEGFSRSLQYAKGRKSLADNPLAYLLNVQFQAIAEQVDNEVKTSMVNLIIKNLSNNEMHEMATIKKLYYVKITLPDGTEEWEPTTTRPPQEMFDAGDAKTKIYSEHERLRKPRQAREHEVYVRKPGGDMVMVFNGKHLSTAQAMNKQNYMYRTIFGNIYDARDLNKVMALMGHMNNMLKALYTSWNVVFPFTNFMRDFQEASITQQIKSKSGGKVIKNYRAAFPAIIRRIQGKQNLSNPMDQQLEDFYNLGGATGYTHMKSPEEIEKDINNEVARMVRKGSIAGGIGDAGHALFAAVEHWNKIFEDATRFSVYLSSLAIGNSKQDAAMDAKEASVNFNRKGKGSKAWDAWFAFFNVAVQSMQKNFKLAKDTPKRFTQIALSFVMLGFLEAMMNALTDDEDDPDSSYYNLNSYMRQNYLVIPLPQIGNLRKKGNKYLSIPLPQFWRGFKSIGSIGFDVATGRMKAGEAVTTALGNFAGGLLPIDVGGFYKSGEFSVAPLVPTITKPVVEMIENRNYMGYTIKKEPFTREQAKYLADAGLGKDNVNPAAKFFTDMLFRWSGGDSRYKYYTDKQGRTRKVLLDVNPSTVEHLFKGYTGGTGSVVSDLMTTVSQVLDKEQEIDFRNTPFVNKFLRNTPEHKWQIISEFYDLKEANDRDITLMKEYERQGRETGNTSQYERMAEDEYRIERKMIFDSYEDQISDLTKGVTKDDMESSSLVIEQMDMCIGEIKRLEARYKRKY